MQCRLSSVVLVLVFACRSDPAYIAGEAQAGEGGVGAGTGGSEMDAGTGGKGTDNGGNGGSAGPGSGGEARGGTGGAGEAGVGGAGNGGSSGTGGEPCPSARPLEEDECPVFGQSCFYPNETGEPCQEVCGDACEDELYCTHNGRWNLLDPRVPGCGAPDPDCPDEIPENLTLCPRDGLQCRFERTLCQCARCADSWEPEPPMTADEPRWFCTEPDPSCPAVQPRAGTSCDWPGQGSCAYGACFECGPFPGVPAATCFAGGWLESHGDCFQP
jgi:hypothetical protein